jgi:hypothetical protein
MGFTVSSVISSGGCRLLDGIGIGLAALWTALGRSTLYPVGPRRRPDHHPTCVGHARPGERDPSFRRHSGPGGHRSTLVPLRREQLTAAAANPVSSSARRPPAQGRPSRNATTRQSASGPSRPAGSGASGPCWSPRARGTSASERCPVDGAATARPARSRCASPADCPTWRCPGRA